MFNRSIILFDHGSDNWGATSVFDDTMKGQKVMDESRIKQKYLRKVMSHPEGVICHHGDCHVFSHKICTCGLLHDLRPMIEERNKLFPDFMEQDCAQWELFEKMMHGDTERRERLNRGIGD